MTTPDVIIVGAGLSGLMAARVASSAGARVLVLDKGRSVGGRMATRWIGPGFADHGAQFFSVRSEYFRQMVARWLAEGLVYEWARGWSDGSIQDTPPDGHPRYAVRGGMNALTKRLAEELDDRYVTVNVNTRVTGVQVNGQGWALTDEEGTEHHTPALVMTPPVPQSLTLLAGVPLHEGDRTALERIHYGPCLAGLFWVEGAVNFPEPGAVQRPDADISWMADNKRKGISPQARIITVHGGPDWSRTHYDDDPNAVLDALFEAVLPFAPGGLEVNERQLKKWRYSIPLHTHEERTLIAQGVPLLAFAGDAFGGPRVEGAVLSGVAAGDSITAQA